MRKTFGKTCLFLLASTFLFENSGFLTHELNLALGLVFLAALTISYFPIKAEKKSLKAILGGAALMAVAVAVMPASEFMRPGSLALFVLGLGLLLKGLEREAPELQLFSLVAAGYAALSLLYRADTQVWALVKQGCLGFSSIVATLTPKGSDGEPVSAALNLDATPPAVVMVVGVNGGGKTTTIGKLASRLTASGASVMLAAGDTFRAAAAEQLQGWADRAGVPVADARGATRPDASCSKRPRKPRKLVSTCCCATRAGGCTRTTA